VDGHREVDQASAHAACSSVRCAGVGEQALASSRWVCMAGRRGLARRGRAGGDYGAVAVGERGEVEAGALHRR
jgi:hypothetical protein